MTQAIQNFYFVIISSLRALYTAQVGASLEFSPVRVDSITR
jgi:hypothetical protein